MAASRTSVRQCASTVPIIRADSQTPGVFARLPELTKGDSIRVEREDGTSVVYVSLAE